MQIIPEGQSPAIEPMDLGVSQQGRTRRVPCTLAGDGKA
jgi:hypothetical protein